MEAIQDASNFNNCYLKSYYELNKKFYEEFHPDEVKHLKTIFDYFICKDYGIDIDEKDKEKYQKYDSQGFSLDINKTDSILIAIMDDDIKSFIASVELSGKLTFSNNLFPREISLLELCSYYGAAKCFKFLMTEHNAKITVECIANSFLGGNPDIISECMKIPVPSYVDSRRICEYAIISHNIDFFVYAVDHYNLKDDIFPSYNNLNAFLITLDKSDKIYDYFFIMSPQFHIPSLCEYFISQGVDIYAHDRYLQNALYAALSNKAVAETIIAHGFDINHTNIEGRTMLHIAAYWKSIWHAEKLISLGIDINAKDVYGRTAYDIAKNKESKEIMELLISHGATV
ncbi:hypothetical protein TVAG_242610 [Trichomonas vaginalis G3]|uniref:DUF3447 domain-containing protein n=1 Tax=Trichomonas vaginalis (strain ATCC PRA-98 / G3) TaxID=412133 RepID=A2G3U2_TRIV3|nr:protein of unknown function (DUF3447) [Trichomonas vaginalis G3]EAX88177.1 hypothetical protein TVAG_242610 [Trichomonas vaginalis G3]KAI5522688.1 protein of unknown function (DUF3447) [Trichomonas vaginalis G3]|eukprot:XP_001301107.1 hypothetical protein [Trichomonas vaginalis G3]